ncbi:hypothetical protein D3C73_1160430 [compost metagenome]
MHLTVVVDTARAHGFEVGVVAQGHGALLGGKLQGQPLLERLEEDLDLFVVVRFRMEGGVAEVIEFLMEPQFIALGLGQAGAYRAVDEGVHRGMAAAPARIQEVQVRG